MPRRPRAPADARGRIAIVLSPTNLRRLAGGMQLYVPRDRQYDYWLVDVYRPVPELLGLLAQWQPSGIITEWYERTTRELTALRIPTVVVPADVKLPGVGCVDVDDIEVGRRAAKHLLEIGLRQFAFFGNTSHYAGQRLEGFRTTLRAAGFDCRARQDAPKVRRQSIEYWRDSDASLQRWVRELPKPAGVFAVHDPEGRCLAAACHEAGVSIPEEVALVSADNDELICGLSHPPLSSVSIPWDRIGYETARLMEQMIVTGRTPRQPVLVAPGAVAARLSSDMFAVPNPRLQQALRIIREKACDGLRVKDLLRALPLSRRTLEQEFATHLQRTPRDEIIRVRMNHARRLLTRTDLPMAGVAERSGFENAERFAVVFRKEEGCPPSRFRQRFRVRGSRE